VVSQIGLRKSHTIDQQHYSLYVYIYLYTHRMAGNRPVRGTNLSIVVYFDLFTITQISDAMNILYIEDIQFCFVEYQRAMAVNCPYFPKLAYKKPGKIIYEKITSSSIN